MVLENWKRIKGLYEIMYSNKEHKRKTENPPMSETVIISKVKKGGYTMIVYDDFSSAIKHDKDFKSKTEAMAFANKYMRTH